MHDDFLCQSGSPHPERIITRIEQLAAFAMLAGGEVAPFVERVSVPPTHDCHHDGIKIERSSGAPGAASSPLADYLR
jgi:hypothetical protein